MRLRHHRPSHVLALGAALSISLVLVGCTRDTEISTVTAPSTSVPATTVPPTTAPPTTAPPTTAPPTTAPPTAPPTTAPPTAPPTTAPPTTPPLSLASLVLRSDGVGPFDFGRPGAEVISQISTVLGAPSSDSVVEYPVPLPDGRFAVDSFGEEVFVQPVGRFACFFNGLCIYAGGATAADATFVGWNYTGDAPPAVATGGGVTVGSRWSDFPAMTVEVGGCFSSGYGEADGVTLGILSEGTPFGTTDDAGNYVLGRPDPADAVVTNMSAGEAPGFPFIDC